MRCLLIATAAFALTVPFAHALPAAAQISTALTALDTTRNGAINTDEWDRGSFALFRAVDKNNNDLIDADELQGSAIAQDTFLRADTDRDGKLSVAEFMAVRRAIFKIADIDRDDTLTLVEFELLVVMEQVGWGDRDQNGRIELSELRESLTKAFEQLDADRDSSLTATEAGFMPAAKFNKFDRNRDGKLTVDEFVAGYRSTLLGE